MNQKAAAFQRSSHTRARRRIGRKDVDILPMGKPTGGRFQGSRAGSAGAMGENKQADRLQMVGRVMVIVMFLTLIQFDSAIRIIFDCVNVALMACVAVGHKTKMAALGLSFLLTLENMFLNNFWSEYSHSAKFDFKKYDFFQTMTVVGGLCMVVALGPGGMSMDESKKMY